MTQMTQNIHDLTGRIAVVTGASSGIGAATARALAAGGARVAVLARRADRIEALAKEIDGLAVPADVTDPASLARAAATVRASLGAPDLVVANAGVMLGAPFATAEPAEWHAMVDTNVTGLLHTGKAFVDDLLAAAADGRPADLVHVGSIASHAVFPAYAVYSATKAGVAALTRGLRVELGPRGVRVRAVEPGMTESELGETMLDSAGRDALEEFRRTVGPIPAGAIAEAIAWSAAAPPRVNVAELVVLPTAQG
ncbi:SDR family oxidoreductase [Pseudonocardia sp. MH-G8]|uniref:SDR family oxidoreductase n=1 Tax=Pseudonocardia sp. MH-G8 TaxID=1854588 RepID=UPI001E625021|nr:SDR family oxidoreductase [Pseudonocardia sp. MH-G8]